MYSKVGTTFIFHRCPIVYYFLYRIPSLSICWETPLHLLLVPHVQFVLVTTKRAAVHFERLRAVKSDSISGASSGVPVTFSRFHELNERDV